MKRVPLRRKSLDQYAAFISPELAEQIRVAAEPLRGLRVVHVNATPKGGGVAEILER